MKCFLHDTSSFDDEKITELYLKFGYEGLGLFYTALEKIGKQEKPVKTEILKAQLRVGKRLNKCWNFMEEIGLLSSNNGDTFNKQLLNFSEKYQIKKEKTREKVIQWRKKQEDKENVTGYVPICNPRKVKESKVKVIKEEEIINTSFNFYAEEVKKAKEFTGQLPKDYIDLCNHICLKNPDGSWRLPYVLKMKNQLSLNDFSKLYIKADNKLELITSKIDSLQTNVKYHGKYTDIYLTINKWLTKDK